SCEELAPFAGPEEQCAFVSFEGNRQLRNAVLCQVRVTTKLCKAVLLLTCIFLYRGIFSSPCTLLSTGTFILCRAGSAVATNNSVVEESWPCARSTGVLAEYTQH